MQVTGEAQWASVQGSRPWRYIVIHHSASARGNAASIDVAHRARGWDGLGYHFVIDNGAGGPDGQVEVGQRWQIQKWGAHTGGTPDNAYNKYGIGICLVGSFGDHPPSASQLAALSRLVSYLSAKYNISPQNVIGHRDAPNAKTECPGDYLHSYIYKTLRPALARQRAGR
jgi:N-acetylmuramoyl-L-alanine amidase